MVHVLGLTAHRASSILIGYPPFPRRQLVPNAISFVFMGWDSWKVFLTGLTFISRPGLDPALSFLLEPDACFPLLVTESLIPVLIV